jgi:predicted transcriptional regulator
MLREALRLTQSEFAERVGVDMMTVARREWGKLSPRRGAVLAIEMVRKSAVRQGVVIDTRAA